MGSSKLDEDPEMDDVEKSQSSNSYPGSIGSEAFSYFSTDKEALRLGSREGFEDQTKLLPVKMPKKTKRQSQRARKKKPSVIENTEINIVGECESGLAVTDVERKKKEQEQFK